MGRVLVQINVVAEFIPASLVGTMWAGTRPAPTTLNRKTNNYVVARFILALWVGCWHKLT